MEEGGDHMTLEMLPSALYRYESNTIQKLKIPGLQLSQSSFVTLISLQCYN